MCHIIHFNHWTNPKQHKLLHKVIYLTSLTGLCHNFKIYISDMLFNNIIDLQCHSSTLCNNVSDTTQALCSVAGTALYSVAGTALYSVVCSAAPSHSRHVLTTSLMFNLTIRSADEPSSPTSQQTNKSASKLSNQSTKRPIEQANKKPANKPTFNQQTNSNQPIRRPAARPVRLMGLNT